MKLTKTLFVIFILIFSSSAVHSQIHIGLEAGLNATKIDGKSLKDEFNYNYLAGTFIEIGMGNRFGVTPEILFSQTSSSLATNADANVFNVNQVKARLNYLSIPILADVKVAGPLHVQAGPQYSILMKSDETLLKNGQNAFKNGDFALLGGLKLKVGAFRFSARYLIGLDNINQAPNQEEWKKQSLQLALGIAF